MKRGLRFTLVAAALTFAGTFSACRSADVSVISTLSDRERVEIFDIVWNTINNEYYDATFHGVSWKDVRSRYLPRVHAAKGDVAFYALFELMLAELRDAHTRFSPPASNAPDAQRPLDAGISLGEADGRTVVTAVRDGSDAAVAGISPGMIVRTVNGRNIDSVYAEVRSQFAGSSTEQAMRDLLRHAVLSGGFLEGIAHSESSDAMAAS